MAAKREPKKRGRQSTFTQAAADEICERLSKGEPLAWICEDDHMPDVRTVSNWTAAHPEFASAFAQARARGFDCIAAETIRIADDARNDWMERHGENDSGWAHNGEHVQRSKLRIETRLKLLAKWDPKRYGERQHVEHSGEMTINGLAGRMRAKRADADQ